MPNIKLTPEQRSQVAEKMKCHQSLIRQKRFKEARQVGPKLIAHEFGITASHAYNILRDSL